jgi:Cu+-exporting ATPase
LRLFKNVAHPVAVFELAQASERRAPTTIDPVCRMQVDVDRAAITIAYQGRTYHFCSSQCESAFAKGPKLYAHEGG